MVDLLSDRVLGVGALPNSSFKFIDRLGRSIHFRGEEDKRRPIAGKEAVEAVDGIVYLLEELGKENFRRRVQGIGDNLIDRGNGGGNDGKDIGPFEAIDASPGILDGEYGIFQDGDHIVHMGKSDNGREYQLPILIHLTGHMLHTKSPNHINPLEDRTNNRDIGGGVENEGDNALGNGIGNKGRAGHQIGDTRDKVVNPLGHPGCHHLSSSVEPIGEVSHLASSWLNNPTGHTGCTSRCIA